VTAVSAAQGAAQQVLVSEPFAALPIKLRRGHHPSPWAEAVLGQSQVDSFLEGPCFARDGTLYVSDLAHGRILSVSPEGRFGTLVEFDGVPNGMAVHRDGSLWVADYASGILAIDPVLGDIRVIVDRYRFEALRGVSDLVFAQDGTLYFSDQGQSDLANQTGRVFRYRQEDGLTLLLDGVASPNGLALSAAQDVLYVAVTRANSVYRIPLRPDGRVGKIGVHLHLSGGSGGPDGLASDADGGLAVAHYGLGRVWLFDALGRPEGWVDVPQGLGTTNVAYGGPDGRTLFITEASSSTIVCARAPRPGLDLFSHSG
jgi:gluconolactonase